VIKNVRRKRKKRLTDGAETCRIGPPFWFQEQEQIFRCKKKFLELFAAYFAIASVTMQVETSVISKSLTSDAVFVTLVCICLSDMTGGQRLTSVVAVEKLTVWDRSFAGWVAQLSFFSFSRS
jgi:ketosteroid isomerase-like protein